MAAGSRSRKLSKFRHFRFAAQKKCAKNSEKGTAIIEKSSARWTMA